jgi:hypothetical protein
VTGVRFKRKSHHWKLLHNPFPATLHAGSCLNVVIRYKATEKCPRAGELIIESDDPVTPVKTLEILAYTIWEPCGCKECCEIAAKAAATNTIRSRAAARAIPAARTTTKTSKTIDGLAPVGFYWLFRPSKLIAPIRASCYPEL